MPSGRLVSAISATAFAVADHHGHVVVHLHLLSRQQAEQKLADVKRQLFEDEDEDQVEDAERRREFRQGQLKIERAVQAGQLTRQEAVRELASLQQRLSDDEEDEDDDLAGQRQKATRGLNNRDREEVYQAVQVALEQAVQAERYSYATLD